MYCQSPSMKRSRPHVGQPGRDGAPRSALFIKDLTVRDIQDCLIRAVAMTSNDPHLEAEARRGEDAELHENLLNNVTDLHYPTLCDNLMIELEKLTGVYPNMRGAVTQRVSMASPNPDVTPSDTRPDLRKFGYAPGGYMINCHYGSHKATADKRASCCLECAEKQLKKEQENV